jgi:hypothetical protein
MRYDGFRDALAQALLEARVPQFGVHPEETIDMGTTSRRFKMHLGSATAQRAEPFFVTASVAFDWDPVESARTYTNEDDLLTELLGRSDEPMDTMPRSLRLDFVLKASLPYESQVPMPRSELWRSWSNSVYGSLIDLLPTEAPEHLGRPFLVTGWGGTVEIESRCPAGGDVFLHAVSLPTWQSVVLPRLRDDLDEDPDFDLDHQLESVAEKYRDALQVWMDCIEELRDGIGADRRDA